jgi:hypothetical protein
MGKYSLGRKLFHNRINNGKAEALQTANRVSHLMLIFEDLSPLRMRRPECGQAALARLIK